ECPSSGRRVLKYSAGISRPPSAIKLVCATHAHPDHIGGLDYVMSKTNAAVALPFGSKPYVDQRANFKLSLRDASCLLLHMVRYKAYPNWRDLWRLNIVGFLRLNRLRTKKPGFWLK